MIYLYVPFKTNEKNEKLLKVARQWYKIAYEPKGVSCTVLSADNTFCFPQNDNGKCKIYILAYSDSEYSIKLAASPNSVSAKTIEVELLVERLLEMKLPKQGTVEIKLCMRQNGPNDRQIESELIREHLLQKNYTNSELIIRVTYSPTPFPGETNKHSYHSVTGTFALPKDSLPLSEHQTEEDNEDISSNTRQVSPLL